MIDFLRNPIPCGCQPDPCPCCEVSSPSKITATIVPIQGYTVTITGISDPRELAAALRAVAKGLDGQ